MLHNNNNFVKIGHWLIELTNKYLDFYRFHNIIKQNKTSRINKRNKDKICAFYFIWSMTFTGETLVGGKFIKYY